MTEWLFEPVDLGALVPEPTLTQAVYWSAARRPRGPREVHAVMVHELAGD